jgi:iron(III) transport system permease protein
VSTTAFAAEPHVEEETRPPRPRRSERPPLRYRLRLYAQNPVIAIGVLALILFIYLIVVPIISLLADGLFVHRSDTAITEKTEGAFTTYHLWRVFVSPNAINIFWEPLGNTIAIALCSTFLALVVGTCVAWLMVRTNMWGRKWFATALLVPYMLPAWTFALAWLTLFKNRTSGGQPGWLENLGVTVPDWFAYGRGPIIVIFAMHFSPFVIMLVGNALKRFDSTLEESAQLLGASRARVAFTVILPLLRPSLISAITLILAKVLGEFGVAYVLGLPVNMNVLATSIYHNIYSDQKGAVAVMVAVVVLIGMISLWVDMHFLRESNRFVTISGKSGSGNSLSNLRNSRIWATLFCALMFIVSVVIPIVVLGLSTVMKEPGVFTSDNLTWEHWIGRNLATVGFTDGVIFNDEVRQAAWNSIWIVGLASVLAGEPALWLAI